jgi:hypothetical protein
VFVTAGGVGSLAVVAFYGLTAAGEIEQGTTFRAEAEGSDNVHRAATTFGIGIDIHNFMHKIFADMRLSDCHRFGSTSSDLSGILLGNPTNL